MAKLRGIFVGDFEGRKEGTAKTTFKTTLIQNCKNVGICIACIMICHWICTPTIYAKMQIDFLKPNCVVYKWFHHCSPHGIQISQRRTQPS